MASGDNVKPFPPVGQSTVMILSVSAQILVVCTCGVEGALPVQVHFIPGVPLKTYCPGCKKEITLARFQFDVEKNAGELKIAMAERMPLIQEAKGPLRS